MPLPVLPFNPDATGYRVVYPNNVLASDAPGGPSRLRVDVLGGVGTVDVQFTCDPLRYDFLMAFERTTIEEGSQPFTINLIMDSANPQPYQAQMVPGTFGLKSQVGLTYIVGVTLQVSPLPTDATFDTSLVDLYSLYLDGSAGLLAAINHLVNIQFPDTL